MKRELFATLTEAVDEFLLPELEAGLGGPDGFAPEVIRKTALAAVHRAAYWDSDCKGYRLDPNRLGTLTDYAEECAKRELGLEL